MWPRRRADTWRISIHTPLFIRNSPATGQLSYPAAFTNEWCSIKEIVDWAIEQGNIMFEGSTHEGDWRICHDRLNQWWEKECQEYMEDRGFGDRQWKLRGASNRKVTKYYKRSMACDSRELQPLDSGPFASVDDWVRKLCSITHHRSIGAAGKWSMATHADAYKTVSRAFEKSSSDVRPKTAVCPKFSSRASRML